ncbi:hypothetical protein PFISCL1PPCAC_27164 [Pristionchus fissidentatus]|uniref:Glycosyltransferase family 92 protein n=1 Tax=Pristionchus fissidentatus TaxID=1538716 RepID=A0AAV5WXV6_9BILA|nr:hypothetical protein PFISCL1PPCAC_27164 [Pristionchus fissidentatus]
MRSNSILCALTFTIRILLISIIGLLLILIFNEFSQVRKCVFISSNSELIIVCQMRFIAYSEKKEYARGLNFSCSLHHFLNSWKIADQYSYDFKPIEDSKVVYVTYSSSNHFSEARNQIRSIRAGSKNKIIFYDLGLENHQVTELRGVCNLEMRTFKFQLFPDFVSQLMGYNFKPIIMAEVFSEFEHYWILDTSVRFFDLQPFIHDFYGNITSGIIETMAMRHPSSHSIFATTNPEMYKYLPMDISLAKSLEMLDANTIFIARSNFTREAVKWNALCALTPDCMTPKGSNVFCSFDGDRYGKHAHCHRYDQSSINIVVSSLLERDGWKRRDRVQDDSMRNFSTIKRGDAYGIPLSIPCQ